MSHFQYVPGLQQNNRDKFSFKQLCVVNINVYSNILGPRDEWTTDGKVLSD